MISEVQPPEPFRSLSESRTSSPSGKPLLLVRGEIRPSGTGRASPVDRSLFRSTTSRFFVSLPGGDLFGIGDRADKRRSLTLEADRSAPLPHHAPFRIAQIMASSRMTRSVDMLTLVHGIIELVAQDLRVPTTMEALGSLFDPCQIPQHRFRGFADSCRWRWRVP